MEPILEWKHVSFSYTTETKTLDDISLKIFKGEQIAVLGANGAGKSTFFLNLNGVRTPDEGEIFVEGARIEKKNRRLLQQKIGLVFQDADDQMIASTVKAEVAYGPLNMGMSREETERRTQRALAQMHLEGLKMRPPHYLSGGEKKRVGIADILAMEPEIILFDEPTAALDPVSAKMLEEVLAGLKKEGKTILLSTHDVDFAYRFANRMLVFLEGKLIADDTPEHVFQTPEVLSAANLKKPAVMEFCELLRDIGLLHQDICKYKNIADIRQALCR